VLAGVLLVCVVMAPTCGAPAPAPAVPVGPSSGDDVETIEDFIGCLNANLLEEHHTIADAVQCLPEKCSLTLTMSPKSAQAACSLGGCQLPRVILDCPGPPRLMPSFLLCPVNSEADGHLGVNRVELGQVVDADGNMRMADVPIEPGPFTPLDPEEAISVTTADENDGGSKGCNRGCHEAAGPTTEGEEEHSQPIDPFGSFGSTVLTGCIIHTDACGKTATPGNCDGTPVTGQTLSQVCECIDTARTTGGSGLDNAQGQIVADLCHALETYQQTRGVCGSAPCPPPSGPECTAVGSACDPLTGDESSETTGYSCQPTDTEDVYQCLSDCACRHYDLEGGGKFLLNGTVSILRLEVSGKVTDEQDDPIVDQSDITASLSTFNYETRTQVESTSLSFFEVTRSGADFSATASGTALVDGAPANIELDVSQSGSNLFFELRDADSSAVLAGGMGEAGRAAFQLTVTP
jgi:hypothetical protein